MSGEAFVANASRGRMALLVLGSAGFVALGLWIAGVIGTFDEPQPIIGWLAVGFFGLMGVIGLLRMRESGPVMRIDAKGIWWRQWSDDTIPWKAIADIRLLELNRQKMMALYLVDASRFPSTTVAGRLAGVNRKMFGGDIYLTVTGTDRKAAELIDAVDRFAP